MRQSVEQRLNAAERVRFKLQKREFHAHLVFYAAVPPKQFKLHPRVVRHQIFYKRAVYFKVRKKERESLEKYFEVGEELRRAVVRGRLE